ncbi:MAG: glycosyltransferase family 4 protein [Acidobacteriota bacterium]
MKIWYFSKGDENVPSSRYRCFFFAEELRQQGLEVEICDPPPRRFGLRIPRGGLAELWRLHRQLRKARKGDVIYLQRPIHNTLFVGLAVLHKWLFRRAMVFDYCDPIFLHSPRKTALLARWADAVVVSCEDLARFARRYNDEVHIVPNSVRAGEIHDLSASRPEAPRPVVGWVGGARLHEKNLRLLMAVFRRLETPFTFRLIGAKGADDLVADFRAVPDLDLDVIEWLSPEKVPTEITKFDIAVLPLEATDWNQKLVTKLLEYLAGGAAVVASPVGDNRFAIEDGVNGFLATHEDEWVTKLDTLLADGELRRRFAERGQETLRQRYFLTANGQRLAQILRDLAA